MVRTKRTRKPATHCHCCARELTPEARAGMCADCIELHGTHLPEHDAETWEPMCAIYQYEKQKRHEALNRVPLPRRAPELSDEARRAVERWAQT